MPRGDEIGKLHLMGDDMDDVGYGRSSYDEDEEDGYGLPSEGGDSLWDSADDDDEEDDDDDEGDSFEDELTEDEDDEDDIFSRPVRRGPGRPPKNPGAPKPAPKSKAPKPEPKEDVPATIDDFDDIVDLRLWAGDVDGKRVFVGCWRLQCRNLTVQKRDRHEVTCPLRHALRDDVPVCVQENETHAADVGA